jgi:hypothetical protein
LFAVAAIFYSYKACADTGWLFGWLIGASKSSVTNTVVPLILALVTGTIFTLLIKSVEKLNVEKLWLSLLAVAYLSFLVMTFVGRTKDGLAEGVRVRNDNASEQAADRPPMKLADDQPAAKQESAK